MFAMPHFAQTGETNTFGHPNRETANKFLNTPDTAIKAGMFARVTLRLGAAQQGVFVPKDAVVRRASGQVVFVVEDAKAHMVPLKTGRTHEGLIEAVEGQLRPGASVVITGNEMLQDQNAVVIRPTLRN